MADWAFWIAAGGMCLAGAASLIATVFQHRDGGMAKGAFDVQVYRAQLAEVARDLAAGRVLDAEADRLRTEISRRILQADRQTQGMAATRPDGRLSQLLTTGLMAVVLFASFALYVRIGAPGYADLPLAARTEASDTYRATRPSQAQAEAATSLPTPLVPDAEFAALMAKLRQAVIDRPSDVKGLMLLAQNEASLGNLDAARDAQMAMMAAKSARLAKDHAFLAELLIALAGGYVSPEAEQALIAALELEPENGMALYYSGLMFAQADRADMAFQIWSRLLEASAPDAAWMAPIRASIGNIAALAGVNYRVPEAVGPSDAEVAAATEMSATDQRAMIEAMVDGLSARLASDGGPAEDWARLITSLGVLGNMPQAAAIYAEAQGRFVGLATELAILRDAALAAGIAQ